MGLPEQATSSFDAGNTGVYPENWPVLLVFIGMQTQWNTGMNGPTGLHYPSLKQLFAIHRISKKKQAQTFHAIQIIESEVLKVWGEVRQT